MYCICILLSISDGNRFVGGGLSDLSGRFGFRVWGSENVGLLGYAAVRGAGFPMSVEEELSVPKASCIGLLKILDSKRWRPPCLLGGDVGFPQAATSLINPKTKS